MEITFQKYRWLVLIACAVVGGTTGAVYAWSVFNQALMDTNGWPLAEVSFAYSLYIVMAGFGGVVSGQLQKRLPVRPVVIVAGVCFAAGWFGVSLASNTLMLYISFSLSAGLSNGVLYNMALSLAAKWFPDKRGLASGVCTGAMGFAPVVFAPLASGFLAHFGVVGAFQGMSLVFLVILMVFCPLLRKPAAEQGVATAASASTTVGEVDMTVGQMLRTPLFYLLFMVFAFAGSSGMMMISHASSIGSQIAGLDASAAALMVSMICMGKLFGCLVWGALSDRIGRYRSMEVILAVLALAMMVFMPQGTSFVALSAVLFLVGFCFGGVVTVMPALCADSFGLRNYAANYSVYYFGLALASIIGPMLAANIVEATGTYANAFVPAGVLSLAGLLLVAGAACLARRKRA